MPSIKNYLAKAKHMAATRATARKMHEEYDSEYEEAAKAFEGFDKDHVWCFVAGQEGQDFRGNPKYLFIYICKYRPDIRAYWLCENDETIALIRSLGYFAYHSQSVAAQYAINRTGVLCAEQVRHLLADGLQNVKYLNLWHGTGFKNIERGLFDGDIAMGLATKYISAGTFYRDHEIAVVTSPAVEKEFSRDLGLEPEKFIRAGYTRCEYQLNYERVSTYDHDLRRRKGLGANAKLVVYAPTYRARLGNTFAKAIVDIETLYRHCERNNILFIFKMHPNMEDELGFIAAKEKYGKRQHFLFWDNRNDFYEIMDQVDLAIVDYSAIISDMVAMGIKHYIRYIFDFDEYTNTVSVHDSYFERTTGIICRTFDEMLAAMSTFRDRDETEEIARLTDLLWTYAGGAGDFDKIIQETMNFRIERREFPNLYSFDVFDTLISRKVLDPMGIFFGVREKMAEDGGFPHSLIENYPSARHSSEFCEREYFNKTQKERKSDHVEITFDMIFARMADVYGLDEQQVSKLKQWELECELENVVPLNKQVEELKSLVNAGEKVVLISDMYLPKSAIRRMLAKADPALAELPLFLSNEYGVLKTSRKLYMEVYKSFEPFYDFASWIHYGDNLNADIKQARRFGIDARAIDKPIFNEYENFLVKSLQSYDSYLVAAAQARLRQFNQKYWDEFVISFVSMCLVPYVDWALRDAEKRGYETLYFVSRDGYHLKRIADAIIEERGLNFKTKLIFASRRVWRVPSYIDEVDEGFWGGYGNFGNVKSVDKLLKAMCLEESTFSAFFPSIDLGAIDFDNTEEYWALVDIFKNSPLYNKYLLAIAAEERQIVNEYLLQEIDAHEQFAIVEFYGRGYNQDCMVRLWREAIQDGNAAVPYYYARSILPSEGGSIRHNFTTNNGKQFFIEAIFANMPYKSIEAYKKHDQRVEPVITPIPYNKGLYDAMDALLPQFAREFAKLDLSSPTDVDRLLFDYVFEFYETNQGSIDFAEKMGTLVDSTLLYGDKREFAPAYTMNDLDELQDKTLKRNSWALTSSVSMSVARSEPEVRKRYEELYQILPGDSPSDGALLTPEKQESNREFHRKLRAMEDESAAWSAMYAEAAKKSPLQDKVVLIDYGTAFRSDGLQRAKRAIDDGGKFETLGVGFSGVAAHDPETLIRELATAAAIITNAPLPQLANLQLREGSKLIHMGSQPFSIYKKGIWAENDLKWKQRYRTRFGGNPFDALQVPSSTQAERLLRCFSSTCAASVDLHGSSVTDAYFNRNVAQLRQRLNEVFPGAAGKKVLLYMPLVRARNDFRGWAKILDLALLEEALSKDWAVVMMVNANSRTDYYNLHGIPGFCKIVSESDMRLRDAMVASDAIVGDYRDTFFEAAMLHKPTYCTCGDYRSFMRRANVDVSDFGGFENLIMGPIVNTANDLIRELNAMEQFDYSAMERVRRTLFEYCDGKSSKRLAEWLTNSLVAHSDQQDQ